MEKKQIIEYFRSYPKVCKLIAGWEKEMAVYNNVELLSGEKRLTGELADHRVDKEKISLALNQSLLVKIRVERWLSLLNEEQTAIIEERLFANNSWVATAMELNYSEKTCQRYLNAAIKSIQECEVI